MRLLGKCLVLDQGDQIPSPTGYPLFLAIPVQWGWCSVLSPAAVLHHQLYIGCSILNHIRPVVCIVHMLDFKFYQCYKL